MQTHVTVTGLDTLSAVIWHLKLSRSVYLKNTNMQFDMKSGASAVVFTSSSYCDWQQSFSFRVELSLGICSDVDVDKNGYYSAENTVSDSHIPIFTLNHQTLQICKYSEEVAVQIVVQKFEPAFLVRVPYEALGDRGVDVNKYDH